VSRVTERQKEILEFIQEYRRERGVAPTHREICEHFRFSSYGTAHKHLKLLRLEGYLRRARNQKRSIELIRAIPGAGTSEREIPFYGYIAASEPIEALPGNEWVTVPGHLLSPHGDHYALRVRGESMIEEGVRDGDYIVVLRRDLAEPGEMVVALVGGDKATLKRIYPEGAKVRLQPSNPAMQPIRVPARDVRVQGVVVGLMRKF